VRRRNRREIPYRRALGDFSVAEAIEKSPQSRPNERIDLLGEMRGVCFLFQGESIMLREYLHRVYQILTQGSRQPRSRRVSRGSRPGPARLAVEGLEERTLLSTLTLINGALVYVPSTTLAQAMNISDDPATQRYTFYDTAEGITLGGNFISPSGSGTNTVSFGDGNISSITVYMSNTAFFALNIEQTLASAPLTVNMGTGDDTVRVSPFAQNLDNIQGAISVHYGTGTDTVDVHDQANSADQTFTMTDSSVSRTGSALISYGYAINAVNIFGGSGNNTYNISGTEPFFATTLNTGNGTDTVNVQATTGPLTVNGQGGSGNDVVNVGNAGSVQQIRGPLTFNNPPSYNTVNVDDSADAIAQNVTLDTDTTATSYNGRITGLAPAAIEYHYIDTSNVTIATGPGGAAVHALATFNPVKLIGNPSGPISLFASDAANTWTLTGQDAGTLTSSLIAGTVTFSGVANLYGGNGADAFFFFDGAGVDGTIDGGGGTNGLNYAAYSSTVLVDLQTGFATGVGGGIANIQNVAGGTGGGAGVYNILVGNGGNILVGGDGRRNLLIAGASASTLLGGNDDDILIGGTTAYDTEAGLVSLQAIMDYWSNTTDDYGTRVANVLSGNGVPLLDATMVSNNGGGNTLFGYNGGAGELNLYYGLGPTLETTDYNAFIGDQFINC
jgi:hypothetical protein